MKIEFNNVNIQFLKETCNLKLNTFETKNVRNFFLNKFFFILKLKLNQINLRDEIRESNILRQRFSKFNNHSRKSFKLTYKLF